MLSNIKTYSRLMFYSARLIAGRKFWIVILLPLLWLALQAVWILFVGREGKLGPADTPFLIGLPLAVIGMGFGVRLIAGEIDNRTLEIAYTVPGGCHRIWLAKIAACFCLLLSSEVILAIVTMIFFTSITFGAFYGVFQAAFFYMIAGMAFSAFFKSEITGAMATVSVFAINVIIGFSDFQPRISPFFNPLAIESSDKAQIIAYTVQNRILFIIVIVTIALLTFLRVEKTEKMLGN